MTPSPPTLTLMRARRNRPARTRAAVAAALLLALVTLLLPTPARAEVDWDAADPLPLAEQRWDELAYGLSLRPWAGAQTLEPPPPGMLAQFVGEGIQLRVFVRQAGEERQARQRQHQGQLRAQRRAPVEEIDMEQVMEWAPRRMAFTNPDASVLEQNLGRIADRPAARLVYHIPSARSLDPDSAWSRLLRQRLVGGGQGEPEGDWILAQAFMQIDPYTVVRFELSAGLEVQDRALATFGALLESVELTDPRELDEHRRQWIAAGEQWLNGLDPAHRQAHLHEPRWLRILKDGEDVGYRRVTREAVTELGEPGVRVEVAEHLHTQQASFDSFSEFFESDDGLMEMWSIRTAQQRGDAMAQRLHPGGAASRSAAAETGLRSGQSLTVSSEGPEQLDEQEWPELPQAYLSQVNLHLLGRLLPRDEQRTLAFYAYHSASDRVALRIVRVVPLEQGGYRVYQRPTPEHREEVATYDAEGRLLQRRLADGRVIVPTTEQELAAIWLEQGR